MAEFFDKMLHYFKSNPIYFYIIIAIVAALLLIIIISIILSVKKSKKKKQAQITPQNDTKSQNAAPEVATAEPELNTTAANTESADKTTEIVSDEKTEFPPEENLYEQLPVFEETPEEETHDPELIATQSNQQEPSSQVQSESSVAAEKVAQSESIVTEPDDKKSKEQVADSRKKRIPKESTNSDDMAKDKGKAKKEQPETAGNAESSDPLHVASRSAAEKLLQTTSAPDEEERKNSYTGKWLIRKNGDDSYYFELRASNGEKLLESINYTSITGAKNGIKTHKSNIEKGNIIISQNKKGQYFFKLLSGTKQLLCTGETYATKTRCESAVESVKRFAETAVVSLQKEDETEQ